MTHGSLGFSLGGKYPRPLYMLKSPLQSLKSNALGVPDLTLAAGGNLNSGKFVVSKAGP
jgi:hypothetical protein